MNEMLSNTRVKGFLRAKGKSTVNEDGEEIILTGWGLGNWLLQEGYMWKSHSSRFDRPQRIEAVIRELTGTEYANKFWEEFRNHYITREDIKAMAEQGYNSVRIPFNWRNLMEDEPGITWIEEGFTLIDRCLDWCEEFKLYAFLDLHGAPGGQTGANIDDSVDDVPRLFTDEDSWNKGIALWRKLAERYKDRWIVGGYDLLNEPIKKVHGDERNFDHLLPKLVEFYDEAIKAIREVDTKHMISIEGHHWATNVDVFFKKYDENMVIHFHRYMCLPDKSAFNEFLEVSERLDAPLWLGETGENLTEWYTAIYPLAVDLNIGYNLWPWKKMQCTNSPYSIEFPDGWEKILDYINGGVHPGFEQARVILDQFIENIKIQNCTYNSEVTSAVFRTPGCTVRGTDFDELPGKGVSYSGTRTEGNLHPYRFNTGMCINEEIPIDKVEKRFFFDVMWDRFLLELKDGEFASYAINDTTDTSAMSFIYSSDETASVTVYQNEKELVTLELSSSEGRKQSTESISLFKASESKVKIVINQGTIHLEKLLFG